MPRKRASKAKPIGRGCHGGQTTADAERKQAEIEREMRLAKAYWLESVQPYVVGRGLQGAELHIAADAHWRLREAVDKAKEWNSTQDGKRSPVPKNQFPDLQKQEFCEPKELVADESLKAETLATIGAPLLADSGTKLSPAEAVRVGHDLLIAAEIHLAALPNPKPVMNYFVNAVESRVPFSEITRSNETTSGRLPLLPATLNRNKGKLSFEALRKAISDYFKKQIQDSARELNDLRDAPERPKYLRIKNERLQHELDSALRSNSIQPIHLCRLRWERFERSHDLQQGRARNRKPTETRQPAPKLPKSAATSPITAGKRKP